MTLLSGMAAQVTVSAALGPTIVLNGTERGFYSVRQSNPDTGKAYSFAASGHVSPVGASFSTGSFHTPGFILNGTASGSLRLNGARGSLMLRYSEMPAPSSSNEYLFTYTITGGTRAYRGDQGSGTLDVRLSSFGGFFFRPGRFEVGRITLTFQGNPAV